MFTLTIPAKYCLKEKQIRPILAFQPVRYWYGGQYDIVQRPSQTQDLAKSFENDLTQSQYEYFVVVDLDAFVDDIYNGKIFDNSNQDSVSITGRYEYFKTYYGNYLFIFVDSVPVDFLPF